MSEKEEIVNEHGDDTITVELVEEPDIEVEIDSADESVDDLTSIDDDVDVAEDDTIIDIGEAPKIPATRSSAPGDPLQIYLREISRFSVLAPEEEVELARRVRDLNDKDAAFRLVTSHLRLVVKIAMDFQRRWMQNVLDLVQEGNVGLMRAVQKFDPEKGIKFSYYAAFWIKAYILKFIMDNWRMVKIGTTQTQRKLFYNLNKERQRLQALGFDPTTAKLSESLGVSEEDIEQMEQRMSKGDMSLDMPYGEDSNATRMDFIPALGPGIEQTLVENEISDLLQEQLKQIMPSLNEKERDIMEQRLLTDSPVTLREIGEKYNITRERVRQIEARLLQKLKKRLSDSLTDFSADWISSDE